MFSGNDLLQFWYGDDATEVVLLCTSSRSAIPASSPGQAGSLSGLTEQERTTLDLIGEGLSNRQIAERMSITEKTVKNYVSRVLAKLGMSRRTQVAVLATQARNHQHVRNHQ